MPTVQSRAARDLASLLFDVDGVLTDGSILVHGDGSESKQFNIRDGAAIVWAQRAGLRSRPAVGAAVAPRPRCARRSSAIRIVVAGRRADKLAGYEQILADAGADRRAGRLHGRRPAGSAGAAARRLLRRAGGRGARSARGACSGSAPAAAAAARCASASSTCCARRARWRRRRGRLDPSRLMAVT